MSHATTAPHHRQRLPDRRDCLNAEVYHETSAGNRQKLIITCGFDPVYYRVREVFTASFKTGGDTNPIIADACVLMSMLMQHGYEPQQLAERLCEPPSLIGTIARAAAQIDKEVVMVDKKTSDSDAIDEIIGIADAIVKMVAQFEPMAAAFPMAAAAFAEGKQLAERIEALKEKRGL